MEDREDGRAGVRNERGQLSRRLAREPSQAAASRCSAREQIEFKPGSNLPLGLGKNPRGMNAFLVCFDELFGLFEFVARITRFHIFYFL